LFFNWPFSNAAKTFNPTDKACVVRGDNRLIEALSSGSSVLN